MRHRELSTSIKRRNIYSQRKRNAVKDVTSEKICDSLNIDMLSAEDTKWLSTPPGNCVQVLDEYGCLMAVNQTWLKATHYKRDEVIGHWFGEFLVSCDISQFMNYLHNVGRPGQKSNLILRMLREDRSIIFVSCYTTIIYDEYNIHRKFNCTLEDITNFILVNSELMNDNDCIHLSCETANLD